MTAYIILAGKEDDAYGIFWVKDGEVEASTPSDAVKKRLRNGSQDDDYYAAVPSRSWQPMKVATETVTRVKLTEA